MSEREQIIEAIKRCGYIPKTSAEKIADNVLAIFDGEERRAYAGEFGENFTIEGCLRYVDETGGWEEFDSDF